MTRCREPVAEEQDHKTAAAVLEGVTAAGSEKERKPARKRKEPSESGKEGSGGRKKAKTPAAAPVPAFSQAVVPLEGPLPERVLRELSAIAFAAISDVCRWDAQGVRLVESGLLTREQAAAVAEIAESGPGRTSVRIKLHPKLKALEMLGRHCGVFSAEGARTAQEPEETPEPLPGELLRQLDAYFPLDGDEDETPDEGPKEDADQI